jgi:hypothetical protein
MSVCDADIKAHCSEAKPDKVMACLSKSVKKNKSHELSPECGKAVFGNLKEQTQDIRLDPGLFGTCVDEVVVGVEWRWHWGVCVWWSAVVALVPWVVWSVMCVLRASILSSWVAGCVFFLGVGIAATKFSEPPPPS